MIKKGYEEEPQDYIPTILNLQILVKELEKQLAELKEQHCEVSEWYEKEFDNREKLQAENAKLIECIEFYADKQNPNSIFNPDYHEEIDCEFCEETQLTHFGKRARESLKEVEEK
jgi:hypothetical protein